MNSDNLFEDSAGRLGLQADAIGHLAQDAGAFAAAFSAFETRDADAFRWVLERAKLLPRCELICEWLQVKVCVLRCFVVCGPFPEKEERPPTFLQFAEVVARLGEDEQQLRRLVDAVSCGDADAYSRILTELKLLPFCHLICRWICSAIWRRFCHIVCFPHISVVVDPVTDLRLAAKAMSELIQDKKAFEAISKTAEAFNCHGTRVVITETGFHRHCELICWTFCVWRCHRVCRILCLRPIMVAASFVEEARGFALAAHQLAGHPRELYDLVKAVNATDENLYGAIVDRFRLYPYCLQLCGWVCSVTCNTFCFCICPDDTGHPWFTTVGYFDIYSDIDPGTGKTNKSLPFSTLGSGGGPNFSFYSDLQLGGFCPATSPTFSGSPMKYRFQYDDGSGTGPHPITGGLVAPTPAGTRLTPWPQNVGGIAQAALLSTFQSVQIVAQPAPSELAPPTVGSAWYPPGFHFIEVDPDGWVVVDPNAIGGGFQVLLVFRTAGLIPVRDPNHVTAGVAVPGPKVFGGSDLAIIFEATRTSTLPPGTVPDFSNSLAKIRINNALEANSLNFAEFVTGCCTPIDATLTVQFTLDHEEMDSGDWSLGISSCSASAPGDITPTVSGGTVTLSARGGFGEIVENTSSWEPCSYTATLTTRPGLTTGLTDRGSWPNSLTFAICGHAD